MKQQSKGIFIHKTTYSESSLIVSFFTEDEGLQRFIFYGGKKKASVLFPCSICEITYYRRPDSDLGKLTEVHGTTNLTQILFSPCHGTVAFFYADIMRNVLKSEMEDRDMYSFLVDAIQGMNSLRDPDLSLAVVWFLLRLTEKLGIEPIVQDIAKKFFLPTEGLFSDYERKDLITYSGEGVELIQEMLQMREKSKVKSQAKRDALEVLLAYFKFHIPSFNIDRSLSIVREVLYE